MFTVEQAGTDTSSIVLNGNGVVVDENGAPITSIVLTQKELEGLALFNMPNDNLVILTAGEGGNCFACHPSAPITEPTNSDGKTLFTDFSYDNLGVPVNPTAVDLFELIRG